MHQYYEGTELICSLCSCEFDIELEGGVNGYIGVISVTFCPMCHSGLDMLYTELHGCHEEDDEEDD